MFVYCCHELNALHFANALLGHRFQNNQIKRYIYIMNVAFTSRVHHSSFTSYLAIPLLTARSCRLQLFIALSRIIVTADCTDSPNSFRARVSTVCPVGSAGTCTTSRRRGECARYSVLTRKWPARRTPARTVGDGRTTEVAVDRRIRRSDERNRLASAMWRHFPMEDAPSTPWRKCTRGCVYVPRVSVCAST